MMIVPRLRTKVTAALMVSGLAVASLARAQTQVTSTKADQQSVSLTVYNSNLALVRDVRRMRLPAGKVELRFADVPSAIEPATIRIVSLTDPQKLSVLEQDFRYTLLTPRTLLNHYIGKQVTLVQQMTENNSTKEVTTKATLLSDAEGPIWKVGNQIVTGMPTLHYIFPSLPPNVYTRPMLAWLLNNRETGEQKLEADYMTNSVNWTANYILTLPASARVADLSSWVRLTNNSGVNFRNAQLQLVAGQVHQARQGVRPMFRAQAVAVGGAIAPRIKQEGLSEYHLYTIKSLVTLPNNSARQIAFLRASGIKVQKSYEVTGQPSYFYMPVRGGQPVKEPVQAHLKFKNSKDNSLGVALPAGVVRVYQADSSGRLQFVGEDHISHTPKDESLNLYIGNAFDVTAERKQTDFQGLGSNVFESAFQITIRNHKNTPITVEVNEPVSGQWTVLSSNFKYEKTSAFSLRFMVPVAANGQSVLNYRVRIHR